jgi:Domain of unknown function (DUF1737)
MKYEIIVGNSQLELEEEVQRYLDSGWKPQGGVAIRPDDVTLGFLKHPNDTRFYQAMTYESQQKA